VSLPSGEIFSLCSASNIFISTPGCHLDERDSLMTDSASASVLAKIAPKTDLRVIAVLLLVLTAWSVAGRVAGPIGWSVGLGVPPLAIIVYAHLHRHYHAWSRSERMYHVIGIAYSSLVGLSWVLYRSHHANHHRFGNAEGDWAKTTNSRGEAIIGWKYLLQNAIKPFILQLLPFLSLFGMKKSKRNTLAIADESSRVLMRIMFYVIFGLNGLIAFLVWQLIFLVSIMYLNYLQHFEVPDGQGAVWPNRIFNQLTVNLGYHDQHHAFPSYAERQLPLIAARLPERSIIGLFNLRMFALFLFKRDGLKSMLKIP
jgi:fatty acid desaturase